MEIFLLICILIIVCNIQFVLTKDKNKKEPKVKNSSENFSNDFIFNMKKEIELKEQEKKMEIEERNNWKPNKQLFVSKEIKEQIFG